jgi:hypothetical protein
MSAGAPTPVVSVVMPVYDEAAFVGAAIESVLRQSVSELELVVVDNGSRDATPEILRRYDDPRLRVFRLPRNLGSAAAGNRAVREARAPLIARLDADDVALPHRLATQLAEFARRPELALLGAQSRPIDVHGRPLLRRVAPKPVTPAGMAWQSMFNSPFIHSTTMFRREAFERAGGYDERLPRSSDFALFSRLQQRAVVANLPQALVLERMFPRPYLSDPDYLAQVRRIVAGNARHALQPESAGPALAALIEQWPELCLQLRGAATPRSGPSLARLPRSLTAFRARLHALHADPAAAREIERDLRFIRCRAVLLALRRRRPEAAGLLAHACRHAPWFTAAFFAGRLADFALGRGRNPFSPRVPGA